MQVLSFFIFHFLTDSNNQPHRYCLVVYYLPEGFKPQILPHGNSKSTKPFYPTLPSTIQKMKEESVKGIGPKKIVSNVSASVGGIMSANDSCELPRGEQQASKIKSRMKLSSSPISNDEFAVVLHKASMEDKSGQFIREVKCLREPSIVVATERQLNDIVRFCTVPNNFSVLTIDPTFCLGDFDVTVITYRHNLLISRQAKQPPAIIGPVLVHYKKTFSTYLYFASALVGLRREFHNIKCFGTDGEKALVEAFQYACPDSIHLTCSIHCRKNVKAKLQDLGVSEHSRRLILDDIFGKKHGSHYNEGLVDARSEVMYEKVFESLVKKWKQYNISDQAIKTFTEWFKTFKSEVIKKSMLKSVREKAMLGSPPEPFTTNASESVNAMLKRKVDYKRSELPVFLDRLKELIQEQDDEIMRALIGRGKYMVNPRFKKFQKSEEDWFTKMKESDRTRHLQRFASFYFSSSDPPNKPSSSSSCLQSNPRSFSSVSGSGLQSELSCVPGSSLHGLSEVSASSLWSDLSGARSSSFQSEFSNASGSTGVLSGMHSVPSDAPCLNLEDDFEISVSGLSAQNEPTNVPGMYVQSEPSCSYRSSLASYGRKHLPTDSESDEDLPAQRGTKRRLFQSPEPSVPVSELVGKVPVPEIVLSGIWNKAAQLLSMPSAISRAPGSDVKSHVVLSFSGSRHHLVSCKKTGQYTCDKACGNWNSLGICSHTVAVAEVNDDLSSFVSWYQKAKKQPSLTKLVLTGMPDGRGKKGGKSAHSKKKIQKTVTRTPIDVISSTAENIGTPSAPRSVHLPSSQSISATSVVPSHPPPLVHITPHSPAPTAEPFTLCFIMGNISVCYGCRQKYRKPCQPPEDLCVQHKEWREFFPSGSATTQTRFCNVYYHCNAPCIQARCPYFKADQLIIPAMIAAQMLPIHTQYLEEHMPRTIAD